MRRLLVLLAACGGGDDPCAGVDDACVRVLVKSDVVDEIDHLELDVLYGELHDTITTAQPDNRIIPLPLETTITLDLAATVPVGIVAAGKLGGNVMGLHAAEILLGPGEHASVELKLVPRSTCTTGFDYCGGDEIAGNPTTLYRCTDGVPRARGRCAFTCEVRDQADDVCLGGPAPCVDGSAYCGGNKVDGDPSSVYGCSGALPINRMQCADGCVIEPSPAKDHCR